MTGPGHNIFTFLSTSRGWCVINWCVFMKDIFSGGVVKVDIYEVDTKIELYVDTFWVGL